MHPLDTLEQRTSSLKKEKDDELDLNVWLIVINLGRLINYLKSINHLHIIDS